MAFLKQNAKLAHWSPPKVPPLSYKQFHSMVNVPSAYTRTQRKRTARQSKVRTHVTSSPWEQMLKGKDCAKNPSYCHVKSHWTKAFVLSLLKLFPKFHTWHVKGCWRKNKKKKKKENPIQSFGFFLLPFYL